MLLQSLFLGTESLVAGIDLPYIELMVIFIVANVKILVTIMTPVVIYKPFGMLMKKIIYPLLLLFLFPGLLFAQTSFLVMTEELPPFNFTKDGEIIGISTEIVQAVFHRVGYSMEQGKIQMYPWTRAYHEVQHTSNTALFSMARTVERENLFKWVGPIAAVTIGVIAKKKRGIQISKIEDFKQYRIGSVRDGAPEQVLVKAGVDIEQLNRLAFPEMHIKKLQTDRIDLFVFNVQTSKYLMLTLGIDPEDYENVFSFKKVDLYIGLHKDTSVALVTELQVALDEMKRPGIDGISEFDRIVRKYLTEK
ncbi:MAG: ABC transporter substrate-binding protein [Desulfuromusa sp.]|nr:ABC transporter substrate-binding protein [Desulfuromusa sp.]